MTQPDKIYIPQHNIEAGTIQELCELIVEGSVEYIRKDMLLEWLNNEVEQYNDKLIQSSNNKEEAIQIASSISSLLRVIAKLETL